MYKQALFLILLTVLIISLAVPFTSALRQPTINYSGGKLVVAVDLSHGENDKYLSYIEGNITWVKWKEITTAITPDVLADVDVLIIGQPGTGFSPDEMTAIQNWLNQGNKILWIAGDSDYGSGPTVQQACNDLLDFIGAKLRLEYAAVYDDYNNAGAFYRVLTRVMPDNVPSLHTDVISQGITKPVLMHGPDAVIWVDENGNYHDPVNETFPGLIRIVWSYNTSYIGDNNEPPPLVYDPLDYGKGTGNHTFVMVAAEHYSDNNVTIIVSGESPYGDYEPMYSWLYHNVSLDGPQFIKNMITWFQYLIKPPAPAAPARKMVVAVDLSHGENDKYLSYIEGNITWVKWKEITSAITPDVLADVDVLIIGQPGTGFSPDEMTAIQNWLNQGNKILWVAGDSDYGSGPTVQQACNDLLDFIGAKLRLEYGAVYDDYNNAGAFYRVLTRVMPDNVPSLHTDVLTQNITKPILMHGPDAVIWVDENGNYHNPVNETFPGLIRIVWSYNTSYIGDNNPPAPLVYDPLDYGKGTGNHTFVMVAAEHYSDNNVTIVVSGESPYGDYEPMYSWLYHNVSLDGPQFIKNMVKWFNYLIKLKPAAPSLTVIADITDPTGDDKGPGTVTYPLHDEFKPGVFDMVKFRVCMNDTHIFFRVVLNNLGDNPWNGPNGFSVQYVHIYLLTTDDTLPKNYSTYGLNVWIWHGWNYAILLAPGWAGAPVPQGQEAVVYDAQNNVIASQEDGKLVVQGDNTTNSILAIVPKTVFSDVDHIGDWIAVVAVTGFDGFAPLKVRGFNVTAQDWKFGGADEKALKAGVFPYIVDLLAPTEQDQYNMLSSYDADTGKLAVIGGVKLSTGELQTPPANWTPPTTTTPTPTTTSPTTTSPTTTSPTTTTTPPTTTSPGGTTTKPPAGSPTTTSPAGGISPVVLWTTIGIIIVIIIVAVWWFMKK